MATKRKQTKKTKKKSPAKSKAKTKTPPEPKGVKVYFVSEETRAWLIDYLEHSPAGQYAPATINSAVDALRDAGFGHVS